MQFVERCAEEATKILRRVAELRQGDPKLPLRMQTFQEIAEAPLLAEGQPAADALPSEIYTAGLCFWASAVSRQLDLPQWRDVIDTARERVPDFPGDATRFFEELFESLTLTDGATIWP